MSETTLLKELRDIFTRVSGFDDNTVLINETNILDKTKQNAPYLFIWSADDISTDFRTGGVDVDYECMLAIIEAYDASQPEKASRDAFTATRDIVITQLKENDLTNGRITGFSSLTGIDPIQFDGAPESLPQFLAQIMQITVRDDG